jgi:HD superfamily phosphohydrolase
MYHQPRPKDFGDHPNRAKERKEASERAINAKTMEDVEAFFGKKIALKELYNPLHPEVYIIPRDHYLHVVDQGDEPIGFQETDFPFSSTNFYVDFDRRGLFSEIYHSIPFIRLSGIAQLQSLVPENPDNYTGGKVSYLWPQFHHTRWIHSLLTAILMEIILARNGFGQKERVPMVIAAAYHDIAMPAGGDTIMRMDLQNLDEEKNFSYIMRLYGLDEQWKDEFGFDLKAAAKWVNGQGTIGQLLDILDKMSYTALDCNFFGWMKESKVRQHCQSHPTLMDVWEDIKLTEDKLFFAFCDAERLFDFLLLRAYEHQELLLNPYSRALDFLIEKLVKPLYQQDIITKNDLLLRDDTWLMHTLESIYPRDISMSLLIEEPEELKWERFQTKKELDRFCQAIGDKLDHTDIIKGFSTGLDWPVLQSRTIVPLRQLIPKEEVELIEDIVESVRGCYVYYKP